MGFRVPREVDGSGEQRVVVDFRVTVCSEVMLFRARLTKRDGTFIISICPLISVRSLLAMVISDF